MAFGDVCGVVTQLVITCQTLPCAVIEIGKGSPVALVGPYTVSDKTRRGFRVFGQALASATTPDTALPIKVRGICIFAYAGEAPQIGEGIVMSELPGCVNAASSLKDNFQPTGTVLKVDTALCLVHVLL